MAHFGRFILVVLHVLALGCALRPSLVLNNGLLALSESLGDLQKSAADAGLDHVKDLMGAFGNALDILKAEAVVQGQKKTRGKELPLEAKDALARVTHVIKDTMIPTLDDLQRDERTLLDTIHREATGCNSGVTSRLVDDGDIGLVEARASQLRGEEAALAQRVKELQGQNTTKHDQLAALMSNKQPPLLFNSFPTMQVEDLWVDYYNKVEEYSATAAAQATDLTNRRNERDIIVSSLATASENHGIIFGALGATFCEWKSNIHAACGTHDTCYAEKSTRLQEQLGLFNAARGKRIQAYNAGQSLIYRINSMMDESAEPVKDDAESRFPPDGLEVPEKAECDMSMLDDWDSSVYGCKAMAARIVELEPRRVQWTLGLADQNCDDACMTEGGQCDIASFVTIAEPEIAAFDGVVSLLLGVTCSRYFYEGYPFWPGRKTTHGKLDCWPNPWNVSTCDAHHHLVQRFCPCDSIE